MARHEQPEKLADVAVVYQDALRTYESTREILAHLFVDAGKSIELKGSLIQEDELGNKHSMGISIERRPLHSDKNQSYTVTVTSDVWIEGGSESTPAIIYQETFSPVTPESLGDIFRMYKDSRLSMLLPIPSVDFTPVPPPSYTPSI